MLKMRTDVCSNKVWAMVVVYFGLARLGSKALRKTIVQEHHENNLEFERYIESTYECEKSKHKAGASSTR